jgi:PAS domain S-box-containing protein
MHPAPSTPPPSELRRKVLAGFGLIFAFLAVIAFVSFLSTSRYLAAARAMEQTRQVLEYAERARRNLVELENIRLRYLVTPTEALIEDYGAARAEVEDLFDDLGRLVERGSAQARRLESIREPRQQFFSLQQVEMNARSEAGPAPVETLIDRPKTAELTRRIDALLKEFETAQNQLVSARAQEADRIATQNHLVIITGTILTFIALWKAGAMILHDYGKRRSAEEALANEHNLFSSIIDTMPDHIFVKDVKGRYILDNAAHRRYLGVAPDRLIEGTTVADYFPPDAVEQFQADDRTILETGQPILNREVPMVREGVVEGWLETTKFPLRDSRGWIVGLVGVSSDITERKRAEEKMKRFAEQLERSNAELQNFANVASHDLQEPLRKIQAFGDRLRAKCSGQLGEAGLEYLGRMEKAAHRMQLLIQDLLKLSRVVTQAQPFVPVDLDQTMRDVLSDLVVPIGETRADIQVGPLPTVEGDPVQLWQLFQNIVNNAMKFRRPGVRPLIRISGRTFEAPADFLPDSKAGDRYAEIAVQDNGIGFEEKFAEQIFVVFQRLHSRDEYEGTGIGLAVCRKITDRHAGKIVARSSPGGGATFLVTLPVRQSPHKKS